LSRALPLRYLFTTKKEFLLKSYLRFQRNNNRYIDVKEELHKIFSAL
jgi:hypothetical protein